MNLINEFRHKNKFELITKQILFFLDGPHVPFSLIHLAFRFKDFC